MGFHLNPHTLDEVLRRCRLSQNHQRAQNTCWAASSRMRQSRSQHFQFWAGDGPRVVDNVPPLPFHAEDVERWISDRNCELRNALEIGDATVVSQKEVLLARGVVKFSILSGASTDVTMGFEGQSRSSMISSGCEAAVSQGANRFWPVACVAMLGKCKFRVKSSRCSSRFIKNLESRKGHRWLWYALIAD